MRRVLVWDLPTRLFHWLFAGSFLTAFVIGKATDDDGSLFPVHMLLGLVLVFMVALRLVWGVVGSRWSRFASFPTRPGELLAYVKGAISGGAERYAGHNPGSSWAAFVMLAIVVGLGVTGVMMGNGSEAAEGVHELLANGMILVVVAHLAGIALHTFRHKELIALSMVDGQKEAEPAAAIPSARPLAGVAFLALTGAWAGALFTTYDAGTGEVGLLGLRLGEGEEHEGGEGGERHERHERDHDEDDE